MSNNIEQARPEVAEAIEWALREYADVWADLAAWDALSDDAWLAQEREAEEDLKVGRYDDFETMDDFIADLEGRSKR